MKKINSVIIALTLGMVTLSAAGALAGGASKGIGPNTDVKLGPINHDLALAGQKVFITKCTACHKFEEKYVGPALKGVTQRRQPEWIMNMMMNPAQMIQEDAEAKALFEELLVPMADQQVTTTEARSVLEYFRSYDELGASSMPPLPVIAAPGAAPTPAAAPAPAKKASKKKK